MKALFPLALIVCLACPAYAAVSDDLPRSSLFFTPQEVSAAGLSTHKMPPAHEGEIHLGAVMYYGPDDWAIWIQGEKWTPGKEHSDLRVVEVAADHVRLLWKGDKGAAEQEIELKPNQSFEISTGKIISQP